MATISRDGTRWRVQVRRAGHRARSKTFDTRQEAQSWARAVERELDQGALPQLNLTFGELLQTYREDVAPRMGASKRYALGIIERLFGDQVVSRITPRAVLNFCTLREREGAGPVTLSMDLTYITTVLRYTAALRGADASAPLAAVASARSVLRHGRRVRAARRRDRRPTDDELAKLRRFWEKNPRIKTPFWRIVQFAIATTMRLGEITSLRWEDYDPETRTILIRDRKHPTLKEGNNQRVPLLDGPFVFEGEIVSPVALMHQQPARRGRVFPYSASSLSTCFTRACRSLKLPDLRFHDLRHDGISRMFEYGFDIARVSICSGHTDWNQLKRYTHIKPESLHRD